MRKIIHSFILAVLSALLLVLSVSAQTTSLNLSPCRDFGYGGFNNDIQGLFSMRASGPENLARVQFYINETVINEDTEPPFRYQFTTDNYPLGQHVLYAIGYTTDGQELRSNEIVANFVPASEGTEAALKIAGPVLGLVLLAALLASVGPLLSGRGKKGQVEPGAPRKYGIAGGGICPKCKRPFALHLFALNMVAGKLERCPYCGKWSIVRYTSKADLLAAEQAELDRAEGELASPGSEEEKIKKELDDSKYQGL